MINEKIVSMRSQASLLTSEPYKRYYDKKQEILQRYPPQNERTREEHLRCIKEVSELMWDINGDFQVFIFEQTPADIEVRREKKVNPKKQGRKHQPQEEDI